MLTQPSRYKRAESNLQAVEKGPQDRVHVVVWVILYLYITEINNLPLVFVE